MKKLLYLSGILVLIAIGALAYHLQTRTVPTIAVSIQDESGGGTDYLPAINGYVSGHGGSAASEGTSEGTKEIYSADMTFKVVSTTKGHFAVLGHYVIERNGVLTKVKQTLPVYEKKPDQKKWSKLDDHLMAFAYMSGSTTSY